MSVGKTFSKSLLDDFRSGFLVFLIALPLSLGIAMASGFPPIAGVLTAIVGGVIVSWIGSSRLTIKGPAAGLIVIALGAVQELGQGDPVLGYKRALAVGVVAASIQILFALLQTATIGIAMSPSVIHGMLAAIGVIIISKQAHVLVGVVPEAKEPIELISEIPHSISQANPNIIFIGLLSLAILFIWPLLRFKWTKIIPTPVIVLLITVPLGLLFDLSTGHDYQFLDQTYHLGPEFLVRLPESILGAISLPDYSAVGSMTSMKYILMFSLVGTIESTLSVLAVDAIDPEKDASNLNRDLLAVGIGNLICAFIGGLPMISEIVRSKANIDAGAKSQYANFFHGMCLLIFVSSLPGLLNLIPLAALAAMLIYTGTRLASPSEFLHVSHLGRDQLALFMTTLLVTLATDLLIGVGVGVLLKVILHFSRGASFKTLFRPQVEVEQDKDTLHVSIEGAASFVALLSVRRRLDSLPDGVRQVIVDLSKATLIDHTFLSRMETLSDHWPEAELGYHGLESFRAASQHPHAARKRI